MKINKGEILILSNGGKVQYVCEVLQEFDPKTFCARFECNPHGNIKFHDCLIQYKYVRKLGATEINNNPEISSKIEAGTSLSQRYFEFTHTEITKISEPETSIKDTTEIDF